MRRLVLPTILTLFAACGGDATAPDTARLTLSLSGFVALPPAITAIDGGSVRFSAGRFDVTIRNGAKVFAKRSVDGGKFVAAAGGSSGTLDVPTPHGSGTYSVDVEAFNASGVKLYTASGLTATYDANGTAATAAAELSYVGPGGDVTSVALTPGSITVEAYQSKPLTCTGTRADGSTTTDFPRTLTTDNAAIVIIDPVGGIITGQGTGLSGVSCSLAYGTRASSHTAVTVVNRTPTTPASIVLESPAPLSSNSPDFVVPVGTRFVLQVRVRDTQGGYAAGASVTCTVLTSNGTCDPVTTLTGNDGTASFVFIMGPATNAVRISVAGITGTAAFNRFGG
ncbi:MAG TPA: hypothetical protein VE967_11565 [Gemmatimonadaceae bacterium]|nr:hypothetical protein [Gemmatimonadaceae bacterium]